MRVTQEGYLTQLTWMPRLFPVNCYLVEEENGLTLIDAALPFCVQGIMKAAADLDKNITRIVLTHAHDDHVGALDRLHKLHPEAQVFISKRDAALLKGDRSLLPGEPETPIKGGVPSKITTRPDILLQEGDYIGSLTALYTPGHTPGSMSFIDRRTGAAIVGDAFQTFREVAVAGTRVKWFPFPAMATWNKEYALRSAGKLLDSGPTILAAGHGNMIKDPVKVMQEAIRKAQITLGQER
ncbi:MBL fold metallo-hydrolase [Paenibacillus albidus]|uniref:MBL fold metallo-hydrolase n=1 Tax=Paenibacillus albidus TaxID=2041023 RepID=A0A917FAN1_9BACL|nr:MBL fold metallo-hydrolase [Paenibacillus albidus]GGF62772.1 MBL fold metallo-hydrolase [Paenibacillus albidus]